MVRLEVLVGGIGSTIQIDRGDSEAMSGMMGYCRAFMSTRTP